MNKIKKLVTVMLVLSLALLTSCAKPEEEIIVECLEGFIQEGAGCIPDPDYIDLTACHGSYYSYEEEQVLLNMELVWSDEFDGTELNLDNWKVADTSYGGGNNELQYYHPDNVTVSDGTLKITALDQSYGGKSYTSGKIDSKYGFTFTYGVVEVRAKAPTGVGTWAAAWMMPSTSHYGGWPDSGEIDIMEYVGYDPLKMHSTIHTDLYNHKSGTQKGSAKNVDNLDTEFHVYRLEWLPESITFYVDDEFVYKFDPGRFQSCPNDRQWPFDRDFYLILNLAIGGDWGGVQGVDENIFPTVFEIDYVRVYQAPELEDIEQTLDPS